MHLKYLCLKDTSNKTRIETRNVLCEQCRSDNVWKILPIKQGLKQVHRIIWIAAHGIVWKILPIKQGLKQSDDASAAWEEPVWKILPIKQGLKQKGGDKKMPNIIQVWKILPIKQGLKPRIDFWDKHNEVLSLRQGGSRGSSGGRGIDFFIVLWLW